MGAYVPSVELIPRVQAGEPAAIARLISRAESGLAEARGALAQIHKLAGRSHLVGVTGVPGGGKSTLVSGLAQRLRAGGDKVGVIAIDPSSPYSGGAILGDRIRMSDLGGDPGVYIRSMATHGATGGMARAALEAVDILDAAGFGVVILETVGVARTRSRSCAPPTPRWWSPHPVWGMRSRRSRRASWRSPTSTSYPNATGATPTGR